MSTATVKGGYWERFASGQMVAVSGLNPIRRQMGRLLDMNGQRWVQELMQTLNGQAVGETALRTHTRIEASETLGGLREVETITDINRATTSQDAQDIEDSILTYPLQPAAYPVNGDENRRNLAGG